MYKFAKPLPSVELLKERFKIDPTTPSGLKWKITPIGGRGKKPGDPAGRPIPGAGYYQTGVNGERFYNSRIIWKMVNGKDPDQVIDHIDNNPSNNSIANLRDVTQSENLFNRRDFKLRNTNDRSFKTYFRNLWRSLAS